MNVIEETSAPVKNTVVEQSIPKEKQITPTVEATHVPINKEITEFQRTIQRNIVGTCEM
jgi:hypothetical protein